MIPKRKLDTNYIRYTIVKRNHIDFFLDAKKNPKKNNNHIDLKIKTNIASNLFKSLPLSRQVVRKYINIGNDPPPLVKYDSSTTVFFMKIKDF